MDAARPGRLVPALAFALAIGALGAAGCQRSPQPVAAAGPATNTPLPTATLPLSDAPAATPAAAPPEAALPAYAVRREVVAHDIDHYAFSDKAYTVGYGFGDSPPDFSFDYQGLRPWAWVSDSGYEMIVEPLPDGSNRYYYFQPGSDGPFLVRDPEYAYGYRDGAFSAVYDPYGRPMPDAYLERLADPAGRYFGRGQSLLSASQGDSRVPVSRNDWYARRPKIEAERNRWQAAQQWDNQWRAYRDQFVQNNGSQDQALWDAERYRRETYAALVDSANAKGQAAARERQTAQILDQTAALPNSAARGPIDPPQAALPPAPTLTPTTRGQQYAQQAALAEEQALAQRQSEARAAANQAQIARQEAQAAQQAQAQAAQRAAFAQRDALAAAKDLSAQQAQQAAQRAQEQQAVAAQQAEIARRRTEAARQAEARLADRQQALREAQAAADHAHHRGGGEAEPGQRRQ